LAFRGGQLLIEIGAGEGRRDRHLLDHRGLRPTLLQTSRQRLVELPALRSHPVEHPDNPTRSFGSWLLRFASQQSKQARDPPPT
jgi:hypothetical protein